MTKSVSNVSKRCSAGRCSKVSDSERSRANLAKSSVWHGPCLVVGESLVAFFSNWRTSYFDPLGVQADGPVEYAYAVVVGTVGAAIPTIPGSTPTPFQRPQAP